MTQLFADLLREIGRDTLPAGKNTSIYEIHSKKGMDSRTRASNMFRNDKSGACVLVTSDVSARGVDYPGVSRVIQVGIPSSAEQYVHRVGRTGRAGTQGRGDLILLPWERGFVNWQMSEVPLKPLTVEDLTSQTLELAKAHDADPKTFFGGEIPVANSSRNSSSSYLRSRPLFKSTLSPMIEDIPRTANEIITTINEEAVTETFVSLVGYYAGKTQEMKIKRMDVLEGCKEWTVQACGLPQAPTLSRQFLDKLGFGKEERMNQVRKGGFKEPKRNAWAFRGQERIREEFGNGRRERDDGFSRERRERDGGSRERSWMGRGQQGDRDGGRERSWMGRGRQGDRKKDGMRSRSWDSPRSGERSGQFGGGRRSSGDGFLV